MAQSTNPRLIGVASAIAAASDPSVIPKPQIFNEFALTDRVAIVSGANRGLGLEMALALCEAGARVVYCWDLPAEPSEEWKATQTYIERMANGSRLEYLSIDVTDQKVVWAAGEEIGSKEGRMDVCIACAGILRSHTDCLEYPAEQFNEVG
jgi:NAD(P)-dependent dehydrogenase (short-subunit alcohol dehydrogenase family)